MLKMSSNSWQRENNTVEWNENMQQHLLLLINIANIDLMVCFSPLRWNIINPSCKIKRNCKALWCWQFGFRCWSFLRVYNTFSSRLSYRWGHWGHLLTNLIMCDHTSVAFAYGKARSRLITAGSHRCDQLGGRPRFLHLISLKLNLFRPEQQTANK